MKFSSKPIAQHQELPLADDGQLEQIIDAWQLSRTNTRAGEEIGNLCYVVCIASDYKTRLDGKLAEILGLLNTLGESVCGQQSLRLIKPSPKTLLGSGKLDEIAQTAKAAGANMLVIDAELTPSQTRNIEMQTGFAVSDREGVILNVFLRHAQTRAARVQVEIAQMQYLKPRIRGIGLNMDQQAGGIGASRGAGETASQLLARRLDKRIAQLQKSAEKLAKTGANQRKSRSNCKQVALVGYTNAGKTSLMNALTEAGLSARNAPFETLDTTTRILSNQPGHQVLISDTVGFIRQLPDTLLASFESTLAQTREADLLAMVIDISDPECQMHLDTTLTVLQKLGCGDIPKLFIFNKIDKATDENGRVLEGEVLAEQCKEICSSDDFVCISTQQMQTVRLLKKTLLEKVSDGLSTAKLFIRHDQTKALAKLYAQCRVLEADANEVGTLFTFEGSASVNNQLNALIKESV